MTRFSLHLLTLHSSVTQRSNIIVHHSLFQPIFSYFDPASSTWCVDANKPSSLSHRFIHKSGTERRIRGAALPRQRGPLLDQIRAWLAEATEEQLSEVPKMLRDVQLNVMEEKLENRFKEIMQQSPNCTLALYWRRRLLWNTESDSLQYKTTHSLPLIGHFCLFQNQYFDRRLLWRRCWKIEKHMSNLIWEKLCRLTQITVELLTWKLMFDVKFR